jgi:hypothetical protein
MVVMNVMLVNVVYTFLYLDPKVVPTLSGYLTRVDLSIYLATTLFFFIEGVKRGVQGLVESLRKVDRILGDMGMSFQGDPERTLRTWGLILCMAVFTLVEVELEKCTDACYTLLMMYSSQWMMIEALNRQISALLHLLETRFDFILQRLTLLTRLPKVFRLHELQQLCSVDDTLITASKLLNDFYSLRILVVLAVNFYMAIVGIYYAFLYGVQHISPRISWNEISFLIGFLVWFLAYTYQLFHLISAFSETATKACHPPQYCFYKTVIDFIL